MTVANLETTKTLNAHLWVRDEHDWYVEPEWCSERLFAEEPFSGDIFDPSCGTGRIVEAAIAAGYHASGADIVVRTAVDFEITLRNFLSDDEIIIAHNIVSNPPFKHCGDRADYTYVKRALKASLRKVALLMPIAWLNGDERSRWLETTPLRRVWVLTPRPSMPPGAVLKAGKKPGQGTADFAWYVWQHGYKGAPEIRWLRRDDTREAAE